MHEYSKGHPMYRPPVFALLPDEREALYLATTAGLQRQLGPQHEQVRLFRDQAPMLTDDRVVSVATANGDPELVGPLLQGIRSRIKRLHRRAKKGNR